jgi:hypothetical protein
MATASPSRKRRQAGGASDAQFCETYGDSAYASVAKRLLGARRKPYLAISHKNHEKPEKYTFSRKQSRISNMHALFEPPSAPFHKARSQIYPKISSFDCKKSIFIAFLNELGGSFFGLRD